jgi:glycosyltransferase involved in cell wall biosynthesis
MISPPLDSNLPLLIVFVLFAVSSLVQVAFYWILFSRLAWFREMGKESDRRGVSVVICARNEYYQLKENLPLILDQDYPEFEVVVVNNSSDDDSAFFLNRIAETNPRLKVVEIKENLNFFSGKKFPLSIGIKSAKYDLILLTDADCRPSGRNWIALMEASFMPGTEIVLGYGAHESQKGILNRLIRFDTIQIGIQYFSYALAGIPYMGVGRNMAYLKHVFYGQKGFTSHYRIPSGDDDLFINRVARGSNTRICIAPGSFTSSEAKKTLTQWAFQKRRHLSTGRYYRFIHKFLLGSYIGSQVLFYCLSVVLLIFLYNIVLVFAIFAVRLASQLIIFRKCMTRLQDRELWYLAPVLEPAILVINSYLSVTNYFVRPNRWK